MIWSNLKPEDQQEILDRVLVHGEDVEAIAFDYGLKSSSLSRKIRLIKRESEGKSSDKPNIRTTLVGNTAPGSNPNERTLYVNVNRAVNIIVYSDLHSPFHDVKAVDAFLRCVKILPHDIVVDGGDGCDMYGLSSYQKNQIMLYTKHVAEDFKGHYAFCASLNKVSKAPKYRILGNHFSRYINWLHANPGVAWVEELQLDNLLRSKEYGWEVPVGSIYFNADITDVDYPDPELIIHHGTLARKHAGNSSRGESENLGYISTISGHVHRLSVSYKRTIKGQIMMAEAGTLRGLRPEYNAYPDWQHGFLYLTFVPGLGVFCQPILIVNGIAYMNGKEIA